MTPLRRLSAKVATLEAELREAREEREGLRTAWHAEIRASAIIDKAAADAMVSTVREAHDLRARLAARDALLAFVTAVAVDVDTSGKGNHDRCGQCLCLVSVCERLSKRDPDRCHGPRARDLVRRAGGKT